MDAYVEKLGRFADDEYGRQFRQQFEDNRGSSELGMLQSPSGDELAQIRKAVAIMTPSEKGGAAEMGDEQIHRIADDAGVDRGVFAIFVNGYALECRKAPSE